jgi:sugar (pentulose or hexulose) kinase
MASAEPRVFLGIDAGTTALKAALFDGDGRLLAADLQEYTLETPAPAVVELDAEVYWQACCAAVRGALHRGHVDPARVAALSIASQGETLVPLDASGVPLRKAIVWLDNRAAEEAAIINASFPVEEAYRRTGQPEIAPTWPACKILWMRRHEPEVFRKAAHFLLLEDFLLHRLTGRAVTEYGVQTSSLLLDIQAKRWWASMLDFIGVSEDRLGCLVEPGAVVGPLSCAGAAALGLRPATMVVTGSLDQTVGALSAGSVVPGIVSETTGGAIASVVTIPLPAFDPGRRVPCHYHARPDTYALLPWGQTAGMAMRWFRDRFFEAEVIAGRSAGEDPYNVMTRMAAEAPPGSAGVIALPHLEGAACPEYDPTARGVIFGLDLRHGREHIVRAIMESVGYMLKSHLAIVRSMGLPVSEVRSLGGGARSDLWLQIKADILQLPVHRVEADEATCLGAAMLAAVAVGAYPDLETATAHTVHVTHTFWPQAGLAAVYEDGYERYTELYRRLKPMFARGRM